jgi:phosphoribosylaminoimidazolecarboxamide formyltransferase/IMP cyclohydrolase
MPTALISVYDKTGLLEFANRLARAGWNILASGGTFASLVAAGIPATEISSYTGAPEILGGRVKTLHPAIHGGILARSNEADLRQIADLGYKAIDLVAVDLYPFEKTLSDPNAQEADIIEKIDIGGVTLLRAAAKNHERVSVLCDIADYDSVAREIETSGKVGEHTRQRLAAKAFARTAAYDGAIAAWFAQKPAQGSPSETLEIRGIEVRSLRYGENPHQSAEFYGFDSATGPLAGTILQGKELSYNNILDLDAAWQACSRFDNPAAVVVKHLSPSGIAECHSGHSGLEASSDLAGALRKAIDCDPISAFGGVIAVNAPFDLACAQTLGSLFVECIAAPKFTDQALEILSKKTNLRLLVPGHGMPKDEIRSVLGGFLRQDVDRGDPSDTAWKVVSKRAPTSQEMEDLRFAWKACVSVKSNAIVFAKDGATVGIGAGQPNRVDSARLAATRAGEKAIGAAMASDAFFPFPDSVEVAIKAGVTAIVHPGGSIRDADSLAAADAAGIALVITGVRHFRH